MPPDTRLAKRRWARLGAAALAFATIATGCTGTQETESAVDPVIRAEAASAAAINAPNLVTASDIATTELLDARTGAITTVADAATGGRAVLVWYWAPH